MQLVIQTSNNFPIGEPWLFSNAVMIYPDLDYDNLPEGWKQFFRDPRPVLEPYEVYSHSEKINEKDYVREIHHVREMTQEEKQEKLARMKALSKPHPSWYFSEEKCNWLAPVPEPEEEYLELLKTYPHAIVLWNEAMKNWEFRF